MGVIDKDDGIGHICLHQPLGQKQGDDTEDKCTPLHKAAGQDGMHCFSFSSDQPQQADHCGGHHTQKRPGRPAEILPEGRDTQHQTEEDQHQHSTDPVKVLQWASLGVLFSGSQYTGSEGADTDGHTYPQHHAPVVGRDDQTAQSRSENNRRAGNQHIQRKPLCYLVGWKTRDDIGHDHRGHSGSTNAHNKSGYHHKHEGICQC